MRVGLAAAAAAEYKFGELVLGGTGWLAEKI